jgi:hypothetical protein
VPSDYHGYWCNKATCATEQDHRTIWFYNIFQAKLNHQRDNMQKAPALAILPLDSMPDGIAYGNSTVLLPQQGLTWQM